MVIKHIRSNRDGIKVDSLDEQVYTASSRRSSFTTSEDEVELTEGDFEDELVEDQYLPSDSELKSGLELMFLKQQRHYWTRKKKPLEKDASKIETNIVEVLMWSIIRTTRKAPNGKCPVTERRSQM